jgi:hypothetical protein
MRYDSLRGKNHLRRQFPIFFAPFFWITNFALLTSGSQTFGIVK